MPTNESLGNVLACLNQMAGQARSIARTHFRALTTTPDTKGDGSPVTNADLAIEGALRAHLQRAFPDHGILGEEFGGSLDERGFVWVLDPIDGTKSFMTGNPLFGTLIAVLRDGRPWVSAIEMPMLGELYIGATGGAWCDGYRLSVSGRAALSEARLYTTSPEAFTVDGYKAFQDLARWTAVRCFGGDCYA
ncbi:inositol monophosphatase family protein, partial [Cupriavidus sp. UYPR2.512]|uniref:inositol monophosphatase family protein n=1 Tax=Cupriavidus sp. UYPR2.512 TaxID=1080187 RepID=UPI00056740AA